VRCRSFLLLLAPLAILASPLPSAADPAAYRVVVHPDNPVRKLEREECSRLFLKEVTRWPGGKAVMPVDLAEGSPVREEFSHDVHRRSTRAIKVFWQQRIFSGRAAPPPEVDGDEAVLDYVREHPGAIGYVSREASATGLAVVAIVDDGHDDEQQRAVPAPRWQAHRARRSRR
jgi:ABC-type phosphate transport system substrate-binding protein